MRSRGASPAKAGGLRGPWEWGTAALGGGPAAVWPGDASLPWGPATEPAILEAHPPDPVSPTPFGYLLARGTFPHPTPPAEDRGLRWAERPGRPGGAHSWPAAGAQVPPGGLEARTDHSPRARGVNISPTIWSARPGPSCPSPPPRCPWMPRVHMCPHVLVHPDGCVLPCSAHLQGVHLPAPIAPHGPPAPQDPGLPRPQGPCPGCGRRSGSLAVPRVHPAPVLPATILPSRGGHPGSRPGTGGAWRELRGMAVGRHCWLAFGNRGALPSPEGIGRCSETQEDPGASLGRGCGFVCGSGCRAGDSPCGTFFFFC